MDYRRYLVEFDTGADLHGMDVTKAAQKAVKGAISHCCMCGMEDLLGLQDAGKALKIAVKIAAPFPEQVDTEAVRAIVPCGEASVEVVSGGLTVKGLSVPHLGAGDTIVLVNAAVTVWVDRDQIDWPYAEIK